MNSRKEKDHDKKQKKNRTLNPGENSDTEEDK